MGKWVQYLFHSLEQKVGGKTANKLNLNLQQYYQIKEMQFLPTFQLVTCIDPTLHIETPTKKTKKQNSDDIKTADSMVFTDPKSSSLNEIDPQQLFERFHDIIRISQADDEQDEEEINHKLYRKLNYQLNSKKAIKLDFSPTNSSMTKKNKIQNGKVYVNNANRKQLFDTLPTMSPIKRRVVLQNEVQSAQNDSKMDFTPAKLTKSNSHCEMAARKQSPFRELRNKI